jgi:hypothetical protein
MAKTDRIAYQNLVQAAACVIVPSSELTSHPRAALTRAGLSDAWRSAVGWTIVTDGNDRLGFNRGGVKVAIVAPGTYATGALLAAAIVTALEAADATPVWACSYSAVTHKFTISADLAFILYASSLGQHIFQDLGYAVVDTANGTSHTADYAAYQSRHVINCDLGSAQAATVAIVRGHNISAAGTVTLEGAASTLVGSPFGPGAGDYSATPAGTDPRVVFFSSQTKRYIRLVINDVQNADGYAEVAIFFVGPYVQPTILESINFVESYEQLSEIHYAVGGAHTQTRRGRRLVYSLLWEEIESSNIDIFRALDLAMPMGACFFLSLNAVDAPTTSTVYGFLRRGLVVQMRTTVYSNVPLEFAEALE